MKCQCGEGEGRPWGPGRGVQRVLGAGQEGHPAPSSWSFLLLSGPATSLQPKASLTQPAEEGGKAKQLKSSSEERRLPYRPGSPDSSRSCLAALIKATRIKSGTAKFFYKDFGLLTFTCAVRGLRELPAATWKCRNAGPGAKPGC